MKWVLSELDGMDPEDERFDAKVTVLIENVRHHVEEEEGEYFPKVRDELGRNALDDLGDAMVAAKAIAPTHPHPRSPDTPPGNLVVGTAAGVVDRVGDTVSGVAQGGVAALGDLIATVLRRKKPSRPHGSSTTRSTASRVRAKAAEATDAIIETTTDARGPHGHPARPAVRRSAPTRGLAWRRQDGPAAKPGPRAQRRRHERAPSAPRRRPSGPPPRRSAGLALPGPAPRRPQPRLARAPSAPRQPPSAPRPRHGRTARKAAASTKATAKRSSRKATAKRSSRR